MSKKFIFLFMLLIIALALSFVSCSKDSELNPLSAGSDKKKADGKMGFSLSLSHSLSIASGKVRIVKDSMTYEKPVSIVNHQGTVSFNDIQVGNWNIEVHLYDSSNIEIYSGSGTAVVVKDNTTHVSITVDENTGNLVIDVNVPYAAGLTLWNKLGSDYEATHSIIGDNGNLVGNPVYRSCNFDNGVYDELVLPNSDFGSNLVEFRPLHNFNPAKFTAECWFKTDYDVVNGSPVTGISSAIFSWRYSSSMYFYIAFSGNPAVGLCVSYRVAGIPTTYSCTDPVVSFSSGTLHHIALSYDYNGIDGSSDVIRIYLDGSLVYSSTTKSASPMSGNDGCFHVLGHMGADGNFIRTCYPFRGVIDNIKIWNYAKTDFSDRFTE